MNHGISGWWANFWDTKQESPDGDQELEIQDAKDAKDAKDDMWRPQAIVLIKKQLVSIQLICKKHV